MAYTAIDDPSAYFKVQLYTGNGSANHAITFDDTDTDMEPDLVWIKNRDATDAPCIFNSVRGATKLINPNTDAEEKTDADTLDSFTSDGFQVDADVKVNTNAEKYVAWCWKESTTSGLDILTFTGDASGGTISHGLSAVPEFIYCDNITATSENTAIFHGSLGGTKYLNIGSTAAVASDLGGYERWNSTDPTSSVFSTGPSPTTDGSGATILNFLWAGKQGFSKFGSYEGNGAADGIFVYTGFRPAFVMTKSVDSTSPWEIFDNKREGYNKDNDALLANDTTVEATTDQMDILSNGFKMRVAGDPNVAETYIYMAFAEAPFVNSNGVPCNGR